jgi:hypothetical protein
MLGLVGGVIAFISLFLPWWSMTLSANALGVNYSESVSLYTYQATVSTLGFSSTVSLDLWYGWTALILIILGGMLGVAGSLLARGRGLIIVGGLLTLLSIVIFAVGLQSQLSQPLATGLPQMSLFSSGLYASEFGSTNYVTYLSYGFWIALVSAILLFVASARKTAQVPPTVPMQTSPSPPQPS